MCHPAVAVAVMAAGQGMQMMAQRQEAKYNESVAKANAATSAQQAADAEYRGALEGDRSALSFMKTKAKAETNYAAGNVLLGSGSALDYIDDLDLMAEIDQDIIRRNTMTEKNYFISQQNQFLQQAKMIKKKAKMDTLAGVLGIGDTLLGGASQSGLFTPKTQVPGATKTISGRTGLRLED